MTQNHWTKELCYEEALKYNTRTEFQKGSSIAYRTAIVNSFLDEITSHMKSKKQGYWTYQRCLEEVSKYKTLKEFREKAASAYQTIIKNNWNLTDDLIASQAKYTRYEYMIKELYRLTAEASEKHIPGVKVIYMGYEVSPDLEENEIGFEGYHTFYVKINNKWCYFEKGYTMIEKDGKPFKQSCYHYQKETENNVRYDVYDYLNTCCYLGNPDVELNKILNSTDSFHNLEEYN